MRNNNNNFKEATSLKNVKDCCNKERKKKDLRKDKEIQENTSGERINQ